MIHEETRDTERLVSRWHSAVSIRMRTTSNAPLPEGGAVSQTRWRAGRYGGGDMVEALLGLLDNVCGPLPRRYVHF